MRRNGHLRLLAALTLGTSLLLVAATFADAKRDAAPESTGSGSNPSAVQGGGHGHTPVTLCHATGSQTNPFVRITTDDDGVLGAGGSGGNGHDGHARDIIPPFTYTDNKGEPQAYPGRNWDAEGQAIFDNGCEPVPQPCPDAESLSMTGGDGNGDDNGCEPPPCPDAESLSMTDNGCEPPPCPDAESLSMTGGDGNGDDNGCEPPPCPEAESLSMTGGSGEDDGDDECDKEKTTLAVKKVVVNDDGGTAAPEDFSFQVNGGSAQPFESDGENVLEVNPGTYTVTEPSVAGYTTSYDNCTGVVVEKGSTEICTITNDDEPEPPEHGRVIVQKIMNGGTDTFEFTGTPAGSISVDGGTISADVAPGQYTSTELPKAGWNLGSVNCDDDNSSGSIRNRRATFNVEEGEIVTCTFRNRKRGMVIVKKVMVGGTDTFDFTGTPSGSISESGGTISADVSPGAHTSTEAAKVGWALTSITCDDSHSTGDLVTRTATFSVVPGETVTCTFTNEKRVGSILVQKQTNPDGHPQSFDFEASYGEGGFSLSDGQQSDSGELLPGTYSVSENVPAGWDLSSAQCDDGSDPEAIDLESGEVVTCVFRNTLRRGSIIVQKQTDPDGHPQIFDFEASYGEGGFSLSDGQQSDSGELLPGTYSVSENVPAGWALTSATCDDESDPEAIELAAGEVVTCVFRNKLVPQLGRGAIDVQKSASPTSIKEPGGLVTFSVTITNVSIVNVSVVNVVDDVFGDLDDEGGNGCFDAPMNLVPMERVNCTFERTITGVGGTSHVDTVTASGRDAFGNLVFDSDDARVDITPRLIDLVIVKEASSPTPLNGIVNYSLTVTNKGPETASDVQVADPAPAGITYLTASPSQGSCSLGPVLVTCSLGTIAPGQTVTIAITARATMTGSHTNTATVTGSGGRETDLADNTDSATTLVPSPTKPPTPKPKPEPKPEPRPEPCLTLTVSPKMIKADGKPDKVTVKVTAGKKRVQGVRVVLSGAGVRKTGVSNRKGVAVLRINPAKEGIITVVAREKNQRLCGPRRIGVVGIVLPPVAG